MDGQSPITCNVMEQYNGDQTVLKCVVIEVVGPSQERGIDTIHPAVGS